jgi:hypothetical protein
MAALRIQVITAICKQIAHIKHFDYHSNGGGAMLTHNFVESFKYLTPDI